MSNQAITWALSVTTGGPSTKVLLIALANYANEHHKTYPSIKRLAAETDMSESSVKRHLADLIDLGLISRSARGGNEEGGRLTNVYTLDVAGVRGQIDPEGLGSNRGGYGVKTGGGMGSTVTPEPIEPKEPKDMSERDSDALVDDPPRQPRVEDDFEAWYAEFPKHQGRGAALRAYRAARKKTTAALLLAGASGMRRKFPRGSDLTYCPQPATWLNGERWADEDPAPAEGPPPSVGRGSFTPPPPPDDMPQRLFVAWNKANAAAFREGTPPPTDWRDLPGAGEVA